MKKKLLLDLILELSLDWNDKVFRNADYKKGEIITYKQLLTELIDKTKKGFPMDSEYVELTLKQAIPQTYNEKLLIKKLQQTITWFKNCFGD